ncbi:MAG: hypothetical protein ACKVJG_11235 [Candidatus Latescibacterota bacterium]|jgi:hypothetical protein
MALKCPTDRTLHPRLGPSARPTGPAHNLQSRRQRRRVWHPRAFRLPRRLGHGPPDGPARSNAGEVAVYFSPGTIGGRVDLLDEPANVVTLYGEEERSIFGIKTEVADLDADGANDLLIGAFYANGPERPDAGKLYIVSGMLLRERLGDSRVLDLARPWPAGVAAVIGPEQRSRLGVWVAAGDVNGDGFTDAIVGADQASGLGAPPTTRPVASTCSMARWT